MVQNLTIESEMPMSARQIKLPKGVNDRLQKLLDRQDRGEKLTAEEKREADGLVELAELLSLWRLEHTHEESVETSLEESAALYAEVYSDDPDLQLLTESALLEPVYD